MPVRVTRVCPGRDTERVGLTAFLGPGEYFLAFLALIQLAEVLNLIASSLCGIHESVKSLGRY